MGTPASFERLAAEQLLTDEWQPFEEIYEALCSKVSPGRALRRYEQREEVRLSRKATDGTRVKPELSQDEKIASGQRIIARGVLGAMLDSRAAEREEVDGVVCIRKRKREPRVSRAKERTTINKDELEELRRKAAEVDSASEDKAPPAPSASNTQVAELSSEVAFLQAELIALRKEFEALKDSHTNLVSGRLVQMEMSLSFLERDKSFTRSKARPKPKVFEKKPAVESSDAQTSGEPSPSRRRRNRNRHSRPA